MIYTPDITGTGGYTPASSGAQGFLGASPGMPFYAGPSTIAQIPQFQRLFNVRDGLVTRIQEGRMNMMRVLLDYARKNGAYVTDDVQSRWPLDHAPINRFYLKTGVQGVANTQGATATFTLKKSDDVNRLQPGDMLALMCSFVPLNRAAHAVTVTYPQLASTGVYRKQILAAKPMPEIVRVKSVDAATGKVVVQRNVSNAADGTYTGVGFTVEATKTTAVSASYVLEEDAFMMKMGNSMIEGSDDQLIHSTSNTYDWNVAQYTMRKWGATDIQQNIRKQWQPEKQMQKNRREALESFFDELEWQAIFGFRKEQEIAGKWQGFAGGMLETLPSTHVQEVEGIDYSGTDKGDFTIPYFNKMFENKFYYGSQEKVLFCGVNYHTAFATMINSMTQNIPNIVDSWGVQGHKFKTSNGGSLTVVPSDKLSLNGMSDYALLMDPTCFQYGHLQNMDINIIEKNVSSNPHEETGEVYGTFTFKRTNPDANWLFLMKNNGQ